jgi:hypothetical protein
VDSVGVGIVVEVSVIGIVEKDNTARIRVSIVSDKVGIVDEQILLFVSDKTFLSRVKLCDHQRKFTVKNDNIFIYSYHITYL